MTKVLLAVLVIACAAPMLMTLQAQGAEPPMARAIQLLKDSPPIAGPHP